MSSRHYQQHDPLIAAGQVTCHQCGAVAYPISAGWLPGGRIIATYPSPCDHSDRSGTTWIVDPRHLTRSEYCHAPTRTGAPCRIRTGGRRCHHHRKWVRIEEGRR